MNDRIPVHFRPPQPGDAVLAEQGRAIPPGHPSVTFRATPFTGHAVSCACCLPRGPAAEALGRLFLDRARGHSWFTAVAVVAGPTGQSAVRAALAQDQVCAGRYRLADR